MNLWTYVKDQARLISAFVIGIFVVLTIVLLSYKVNDYHIRFVDAWYGGAMGILCLAVGLGIDYIARRPIYRELQARQDIASSDEFGDFPTAGTTEQRLWAQLFRRQQSIYLQELAAADDERKFSEMFLTRFAHQMKTPLTVIQLLGEELKKAAVNGVDTANTLTLLSSLDDERDRLDANLNLILQTARLTSFSFDLHMESVELVELIRNAVNEHKAAWIRRSLYPRIDCEVGEVFVQSDRKWLLFVIDQFLRNALQYGVRPGPGVSTSEPFIIRLTEDGDRVAAAFIDQGIGIPERDLAHVFDPFFTGANGRNHSRATGMGLYLVKQVCERLGHQVHVSSTENVGTTFTLLLDKSGYLAPLL